MKYTPALDKMPIIQEYDILSAECGDYSSVRLRNTKTGSMHCDGASSWLIPYVILNAEKHIGEQIRITIMLHPSQPDFQLI